MEMQRHTIETGIPAKYMNTELTDVGIVTDIIETGVDNVCIAHIETGGRCLTTIFTYGPDGYSGIREDELPGKVTLATIICALASCICHEMPISYKG